MTVGKQAREFRGVAARRAEEEADIVAALQQAEGASTVQGLAVSLWHQGEELRQELAAARDREAALRSALQDVQRRAAGMATQVAHLTGDVAAAEARVRTTEAERDEARAAEDAALRRETALQRRLQAAEARLAQVGTAPPPRPALEAVGQVTGAEVCLWVRQTRALSALRDVPAERWDRDDAAPLRRQVYRLQQHAPGAGRAALSERALELARTLGGG